MTPEEFVEVLRKVVLEQAIKSTVSLLEHPPGRRPDPELVEASAWYHRLSDQDRAKVRSVATMTAHGAVFGFLAVLDGVRAVEKGPDKGTFTLIFRKGGQERVLNPDRGMMLHDLLNLPPEDETR